MSSSVQPTQLPPHSLLSELNLSQASILGPGIVGIFIQGIESGLVIAQFSRWYFRPDRSGGYVLSIIVTFVTIVGLVQTGMSFASVWCKYVERFGMLLRPDWGDMVQSIPTQVISFPVQALMIGRCYFLVNKNLFIIAPLVVLLVASVVMTGWSMTLIVHCLTSTPEEDWGSIPQLFGILWPYFVSLLLPSVLDVILTGILLHNLTRTMKRVYAPHKRKRIIRLVNIVWQSALPPTLFAITTFVLYFLLSTRLRITVDVWFPIIQAMMGKLYVLSLIYMINANPLQPNERPTLMSTLTVPAEVMCTLAQNARDDLSDATAAEHEPEGSTVLPV
ncbi:hypothetical protein EI94DRAFT_1784790 [Lactarius quietus]|nr:hypothetical protein EI94DRAFT_1784790 [Lactarius quietus]